MPLPILYSFRRCPYAIRARLALAHCGIDCEVREVELRNKPAAMLAVSSKATVPVLCFSSAGVSADSTKKTAAVSGNMSVEKSDKEITVIDESLEIMAWAADGSDSVFSSDSLHHPLIVENDGPFKQCLDRYKYFDRYPEQSQDYYWQQLTCFLKTLDDLLLHNGSNSKSAVLHLGGAQPSLLDWAIFPFIRQCYLVSPQRFESLGLVTLNRWLAMHIDSSVFTKLMRKRPYWRDEQDSSYRLLEA